jgi:hypothetical protein
MCENVRQLPINEETLMLKYTPYLGAILIASLITAAVEAYPQPNPPLLTFGKFANTAPVAWIAPTETIDGQPASDLAGFKVYFGGSPTQLNYVQEVPSASATSALIEGLPPGTWYFAVSAYNSAREESEKSNLGTMTF